MKLPFLLSAVFPALTLALSADPIDLAQCGKLENFKPAPYLKVAVALQALPVKDALSQMVTWSSDRQNDEKVIILCRMLFQPGDKAFRAPMLGAPEYYGRTTKENWPLEPIALVDGIPFKVIIFYSIAGQPEPAASYLAYCMANQKWTTTHYKEATAAEIRAAYDKLVRETAWKRPLTPQELRWLESQISQ